MNASTEQYLMDRNEEWWGAPVGPWPGQVRRPILAGLQPIVDPDYRTEYEVYDPIAGTWTRDV